ncbi:hypothetical protein FOMG_17597 [Fusarium oxysporum f. sp. melonis 26406]|uniref:Uncharacterized protein n=1 Tax=Fusarium oxysporum f. sp. melonis 26406 TaxID=1089452 RepID=W9ZXG4_FUSOX|nr:hypothetical protein FOMG_17597 [Fusarium oxysporum f. sp. melonis 26406]
MGSTVTPSSFFLSPSPDAVRVGRLIKNIKYPLEGYYDPTTDEPNVIETQVSASTINRQNSKTGFGSALKSSTSIEVSKRLDSQTHVVPADVKNGYYLDNSDAWFHKANSQSDELQPTFIEKRVCLLQYRKVKTRWFSTRLTKPLQLSTTRQWSYTKGLTSYC